MLGRAPAADKLPPRPRRPGTWGVALLLVVAAAGCDPGRAPSADGSSVEVDLPAAANDNGPDLPAPNEPRPSPAGERGAAESPTPAGDRADGSPGDEPGEPAAIPLDSTDALRTGTEPPTDAIERRKTTRAMMVYVEPRFDAEFRGKLPHGAVIDVFEHVDGPDCRGAGWGRVGTAAYACLQRTEPTEDPATLLPAQLVDGLAPFFYARIPRGAKDGPADALPPKWRSRRAMRAGADPEDRLRPEHDYSFVRRRRFRDGAVLTTPDRRVVYEADVRRLKPSDFAGRDLLAHPVPAGTVLGWSIMWPFATVGDTASAEPTVVAKAPLHTELLTHPEPRTERGQTYVPVSGPTPGFVDTEQIRRWLPIDPPPGIGRHEVWLDVDLEQQTLALHRGSKAVFVTLISSGNYKHATPTGLFRLTSKWAWADMRSREGDEEPYFVEGVPWVQYFRGRYALHGTFWHNRFGRRTSHGCINLSAHDARWVYERTMPAAKPGWIVVHEHTAEPGTLLRIRKGEQPVADRRK